MQRTGVDRDAVRVAALRMLLQLTIDSQPAPFVMHGKERAFIDQLLRHASPAEVAHALNLSLEEVAGGCIRLIRSGYAAASTRAC